jgi:hypothetical protein
VEADVEEREEPKHAAEADHFGQIQEFTKWSDAERENKKAQRPITGLMLKKLDGICGQVAAMSAPGNSNDRKQREREDEDLSPLAG